MITSANNRKDYTVVLSQTVFPYDFKILDEADLEVYLNGSLQTLNTNYTVTGAGEDAGGNVIFGTALVAGDTVAIIRSLAELQQTDYVDGDPFAARTVENDFDKMVMLIQQIREVTDRCLKFSKTSAFKDVSFPELVASKFLQVNALGTALSFVSGTPFAAPVFLDGSPFNGLWYDSSTFASINAAVSAIGATEAVLVVSTPETLAASLTIPANIAVVIQKGGKIIKSSTYTLTISGPLTAGKYQIFGSFASGDVTLSRVSEIYPEWWTTNTTPGTTDMTTAINYAIATATKTDSHRIPVILDGYYSISGPINITANGTTILGSGFFGGWITATHSSAGFVIDKGGGAITYNVKLKDIYFNGQNLAATGLKITNGNECQFENVHLNAFTTYGMHVIGYYSNFIANAMSISYVPVGARLEAGVFLRFLEPNFYETDIAFDIKGTIYVLIVDNGWFEAFETFLNVSSTAEHINLMSATLKNCYFLSTKGGVSYTARVIKSYTNSNSYANKVSVLKMDGCYLYLTNAKYVLEVDWNGNFAGGELRMSAMMKDNYIHNHDHMTAWLKSDMANVDIRWVKVDFINNYSLAGLPVQDGTQMMLDMEYFAANDGTPSVGNRSGIYKTRNHAATEITTFDNGYIGQKIMVIFGDAFTSVNFTGGNLRGNDGVDFIPTTGDWMECVRDETLWYCSVHKSGGVEGGGTPPEPPVIPPTNLITQWINVGYDVLTTSGANITSAIYDGAIASTNTGLFWVESGKSYTITINLTLNSGEAPTLSYHDGGVTVNLGALSPGVNTFTFTSTGTQSWLQLLNHALCDWSCTAVFAET